MLKTGSGFSKGDFVKSFFITGGIEQIDSWRSTNLHEFCKK